jgi:hypothetical protein
MDPDEPVRLQFRCTVPRWVVDSLKHEAAKERRSVANLLAKWLIDNTDRLPEQPPIAPPPPPQQTYTPSPTPQPPRQRHDPERPLTDMPDFSDA